MAEPRERSVIEPAPAPTQAALERAERALHCCAVHDNQLSLGHRESLILGSALAIDAAVEAERAACEAALERLAERASRGDISCFDVLFERAAIAARRGK